MSRARAFGLALAVLWVPHLLPFTQHWFTECDDCTTAWLARFPILPGLILALPVRFAWRMASDAPLNAAAGAVTLTLSGLLAWALRRWPTRRWWIGGGVAALAAVNAIALAHLFRA